MKTSVSLEGLVENLKRASSVREKIEFLKHFSPVPTFLKKIKFTQEEELVIKSLSAIGQAERIFAGANLKTLKSVLKELVAVDKFYAEIGGLVGYHQMMLELLTAETPKMASKATYHPAEGVDISVETKDVRKAILSGIHGLAQMGEIYPLGGAADRLRLSDEKTGVALPAARLPFLGKTLLEGLIADLQSREYLHYKLWGKRITTPVAVMTSREKNNHQHILSICEESKWFGRAKENFRFFCQPSVPTVNRDGQWCLQGPMQLLLKPGGHGVIWRLARDEGIFDWFFSKKRKKGVVRQINNPVANTDYGLLAFTGIGCAQDKIFGFASCPRQVKATEGINVLIERPHPKGYEYVLTNIEYCDFKKFGIVDQPEKASSPYSKFSSNTNILFVDFEAILEAVRECPIPGILVNLKKLTYRTEDGQKKEEEIARLESTMQNIADFFREVFPVPLSLGKKSKLKTFLTYNERRKTISTAKREFTLGASLLETPEGCFLDILKNVRELLKNNCGMQVPEVSEPSSFFAHGPSFVCLYHPALGPLYSVIRQKIRGGQIKVGSELQLEIAELDMEKLDLKGSLLIQAQSLMGHFDKNGILNYSEKSGKCTLKNVKVRNKGIDFEAPNSFWKNEIVRKEVCQIILHGNAEFYAENVCLSGDLKIEVKDGIRVRAVEEKGNLKFIQERISKPTWFWKYSVNSEDKIVLKK